MKYIVDIYMYIQQRGKIFSGLDNTHTLLGIFHNSDVTLEMHSFRAPIRRTRSFSPNERTIKYY